MRTMIVVTGVDSPQIYGRNDEKETVETPAEPPKQEIDYVE